MFYVVEAGQSDHFSNLFELCKHMGLDKNWNLRHVRFGRIRDMSSRSGQVVFLEQILDQARELMLEKQLSSKSKFRFELFFGLSQGMAIQSYSKLKKNFNVENIKS